MAFRYETCLLKHHVRMTSWLPFCRERLKTIRRQEASKEKRRLRYFTFCAVGAVDVFLLDMARVIRPSDRGFDAVVFFDKDTESVTETLKRIPGAVGFPGDFTKVILLDDPYEDDALDALDALEAPEEEGNTQVTWARQNLLAQRRNFIQCFPFDVINLDLEEYLFKPNDEFPGRVVNAMQRIFRWQQRRFMAPNHRALQMLKGFTLMFTTRIGPPNISETYLDMLRSYLVGNLQHDASLIPELERRTGGVTDISELQQRNFDLFFKLSVPKVIASILKEEDWYVDPDNGIEIYEFKRREEDNPYKILHMVMDVLRQDPPQNRRAPGINLPQVDAAYADVAHRLISNDVISVSYNNIDEMNLQESLDMVLARRRKYYAGD